MDGRVAESVNASARGRRWSSTLCGAVACSGALPAGHSYLRERTSHAGRRRPGVTSLASGQELRLVFDAERGRGGRRHLQDDMASWNRQGQIVVLSAADEVPALEERHLELSADSKVAGTLRDQGGRALFLPGVDGDVAGLYALDATYGAAIRAEIADAVRRLGFDTQVSDEETAARLLTG